MSATEVKDVNAQLAQAAQEGNLPLVEQLVNEQGAAVNASIHNGRPALYMAAAEGHAEVVSFLISHGAAADTSYQGFIAAYVAAQNGHADVLQCLIVQGKINIKQTSTTGGNLLHVAAQNGKVQAAKALLEHKADMSCQTQYGVTPFAIAVDRKHSEVVDLLLQQQKALLVEHLLSVTTLSSLPRALLQMISSFVIDKNPLASEEITLPPAKRRKTSSPHEPKDRLAAVSLLQHRATSLSAHIPTVCLLPQKSSAASIGANTSQKY